MPTWNFFFLPEKRVEGSSLAFLYCVFLGFSNFLFSGLVFSGSGRNKKVVADGNFSEQQLLQGVGH